MNIIVNQMALLYAQELYSDMSRLTGELALSAYEQKQDLIAQYGKFQLYVYYAEALYNLQDFIGAEKIYSLALQIRKYITKSKTTTKVHDGEKELVSDVDIKYKVHLCCLKLKHHQRAMEILQSINARARTPKINMALGNLYRDAGMERPAISCYKEVLKECPLALDIVENLLKLDVSGTEVNSLMLGVTTEIGWVNTWLRGIAEMHLREHKTAITTFKSLDAPGMLKDNCSVLLNMSYCYDFLCDETNALAVLQRVKHINPNFIHGKDFLASLLSKSFEKGHHQEIEKLIPDMDTSMWSSEHWVVLGYHMFVNKKFVRAGYFAKQACLLNKRNIEAILLRAAIFNQLNEFQEASCQYREALQYCPQRFEAVYGLVQSYISMNRLREATTVANNACKQTNHASAALTLYASVLLKDPMNVARGRGVLERAIASEPNYMLPVYLLAEQLEQEQSYEEAVTLLKRYIETNPSSRLYQMLADCYIRLQKEKEAFEHYNVALRLNPKNQRALEGIASIGKSSTPNKMDSSFYMSGAESSPYVSQTTSNSDQEADPDSDTDQWLNTRRIPISFE